MWPFKDKKQILPLKEKWDMQAVKAHTFGKALLQAADNGAFKWASDVIMLGAPIDHAEADGVTALRKACEKKDGAMIKLLLAHRADLFREDANKKSPYDACLATKDPDFIFTTLLATLESRAEVVAALIARPNWEEEFQDKFGPYVEKAAQALDQKTMYNVFQKLVSFLEVARQEGLADAIPAAQELTEAIKEATETLKPKPAVGVLRL